MASEPKSTWDQLLELRAMTDRFGVVYEAQVLQLKYWGRLALPHADKVDVSVGLPYLDDEQLVLQHLVEFRCKPLRRPPVRLRNLLNGLTRSVRDLLGRHFGVQVFVDGRAIFTRAGEKRKPQDTARVIERLREQDRQDAQHRTNPGE